MIGEDLKSNKFKSSREIIFCYCDFCLFFNFVNAKKNLFLFYYICDISTSIKKRNKEKKNINQD